MRALVTLVPALAAGFLLSACSRGESSAPASPAASPEGQPSVDHGGFYLALGDSLAAGTGATAPDRGYVGHLRDALRRRLGADVVLENLAKAGATTQSLIDEQLPQAEQLLRDSDVRLLTIDIGGNDFAALFGNPGCLQEALTPDCPLASVLEPVRDRLDSIFSRLRAAGPDVPMAVMTYPNLFSGSGHPFELPAANALSRLNDVIRDEAGRYGLLVVDPTGPFEGKSLELTGVGSVPFDPHPNDAGHAVLAQAFEAALFP